MVQAQLGTRNPTVRVSNADLRTQQPSPTLGRANAAAQGANVESAGNEIFDAECLRLINEYFYGVRIYPGQDPTHVYVGWVTTQYHFHGHEFNKEKVRRASVCIAGDYENQILQQ